MISNRINEYRQIIKSKVVDLYNTKPVEIKESTKRAKKSKKEKG